MEQKIQFIVDEEDVTNKLDNSLDETLHEEESLEALESFESFDDDSLDEKAFELEGDTERTLKVRLDKWLWAARFFKTRALARAAVEAGKVYYNGERSKPSREIELEALLQIRQGRFEKTVIVKGLSTRRRSTEEALQLFEETETSRTTREFNREFQENSWGDYPRQSRQTFIVPEPQQRRSTRFLRRSFNRQGQPGQGRPDQPDEFLDFPQGNFSKSDYSRNDYPRPQFAKADHSHPRDHYQHPSHPSHQSHQPQQSHSTHQSQNYPQQHYPQQNYSHQNYPSRNQHSRQDYPQSYYPQRSDQPSRNDYGHNSQQQYPRSNYSDNYRSDHHRSDHHRDNHRDNHRSDYHSNPYRNEHPRQHRPMNPGYQGHGYQGQGSQGQRSHGHHGHSGHPGRSDYANSYNARTSDYYRSDYSRNERHEAPQYNYQRPHPQNHRPFNPNNPNNPNQKMNPGFPHVKDDEDIDSD